MITENYIASGLLSWRCRSINCLVTLSCSASSRQATNRRFLFSPQVSLAFEQQSSYRISARARATLLASSCTLNRSEAESQLDSIRSNSAPWLSRLLLIQRTFSFVIHISPEAKSHLKIRMRLSALTHSVRNSRIRCMIMISFQDELDRFGNYLFVRFIL